MHIFTLLQGLLRYWRQRLNNLITPKVSIDIGTLIDISYPLKSPSTLGSRSKGYSRVHRAIWLSFLHDQNFTQTWFWMTNKILFLTNII
jgi:hypothetical protein